MKERVGKLFESRKGQMDYLLHRDFINNGIATYPVKISSYDDVIHPNSVRRYETLNQDFADLIELGAGVLPPDCPIVLNIIEDCLTDEERKIIVATIREYYAYNLGMEIGMTRWINEKTRFDECSRTVAPFPPESERMNIEEMIIGYTINGAIQLGIEPGKDADFLVFDKDLLTAEHAGFSFNAPTDVFINGKKVN